MADDAALQRNRLTAGSRGVSSPLGSRAVVGRAKQNNETRERNTGTAGFHQDVPGRSFRFTELGIREIDFQKKELQQGLATVRDSYIAHPDSSIVVRGSKSPSKVEGPRYRDIDARRGEAAKQALIKAGIPADRIRVDQSPPSGLDPDRTDPQTKASMRGANVEIVPNPPKPRRPERFSDDTHLVKAPHTEGISDIVDLRQALNQDTLYYLGGLVFAPKAAEYLNHAWSRSGSPVQPPVDWILKGWGSKYENHFAKKRREAAQAIKAAISEHRSAGKNVELSKAMSHAGPEANLSNIDQIAAVNGADFGITGKYDWFKEDGGEVKVLFHDLKANFHDDYIFRQEQKDDYYEYRAQQMGYLEPFEVKNSWSMDSRYYRLDPESGFFTLISGAK